MQHASLHITQPAEGVYAISAAQVLEARIVKALGTVAQLVVDDPAYVPVFERLEQELDNIQSRNDAIERARKYLPPSS